jgi:hypothetical protein
MMGRSGPSTSFVSGGLAVVSPYQCAYMSSTPALEPHPQTRVLVSNLPGVVFDVLSQVIVEQPDMLLVGNVQGPLDTLLAVIRGVDVLILGASQVSPAPGICTQLLGEVPHLRIVVLSFNGDSSRVYWRGMRGQRIQPVSGTSVVSAIRTSRNLG